jgi:hypothetical protein
MMSGFFAGQRVVIGKAERSAIGFSMLGADHKNRA